VASSGVAPARLLVGGSSTNPSNSRQSEDGSSFAPVASPSPRTGRGGRGGGGRNRGRGGGGGQWKETSKTKDIPVSVQGRESTSL